MLSYFSVTQQKINYEIIGVNEEFVVALSWSLWSVRFLINQHTLITGLVRIVIETELCVLEIFQDIIEMPAVSDGDFETHR